MSPRVSPKNGGCLRECPTGCLRAPGSGVSKKCPESVPGVSKRCPGHSGNTLGTPFGHSGARTPKGPGRRTLPRTPPVFGDTLGDTPGTLRARRARETPVAGRRDRNTNLQFNLGLPPIPEREPESVQNRTFAHFLRKKCALDTFGRSFWNQRKPQIMFFGRFGLCGSN